jgi:UDP-N-acetylmuramate--alanine ligase
VLNSLAALAVGVEFELPFGAIRDGLAGFGGVARRFEIRGEHGGVILVDDYGHHPTEIEAVLAAGRSTWPDRRLVAVFQPHRFTRTRDLLARFAVAFAGAGQVIVVPIYPAGEKPIPGVTSAGLAAAVEEGSRVPVTVAQDLAAASQILSREVRAGDVILTLGAGDVWRVGETWLAGANHPAEV